MAPSFLGGFPFSLPTPHHLPLLSSFGGLLNDVSFFPFHYFYWFIKLLSVQFSPLHLISSTSFSFPCLSSLSKLTITLMFSYFIWRKDISFPHPRSSIFSFSFDSNKIKPLKYAHSSFSCSHLPLALLTMKLRE